MSIFQLLAAVFALFMMYVVRLKSQKYRFGAFETICWYVLWILFVYLAIFPATLLGIAQVLRFARVFDLLVVGAFMILTGLVMYLYFLVREMQAKIDTLVRQRALEK